MITFSIALILLVVGYWIYGGYVNKLFAPDPNRKTPALTMTDGVDFIPLIFGLFSELYLQARYMISWPELCHFEIQAKVCHRL